MSTICKNCKKAIRRAGEKAGKCPICGGKSFIIVNLGSEHPSKHATLTKDGVENFNIFDQILQSLN